MPLLTDIDAFVEAYKGTTVYWIDYGTDGKTLSIFSGKIRGFRGDIQTMDGQTEIIIYLITNFGIVLRDSAYETIEAVTAAIDAYLTNLRNSIIATIET